MTPVARLAFERSFAERHPNPHALRQLAYFPRLGLCHNRIKKNANTSVVLLLSMLETGQQQSRAETKRGVSTLADLPVRELLHLRRYRHSIVTRNPYSRVLSAFLEKMRLDEFRSRYRPFELTPEGFGEFLSWLDDGHLLDDNHWAPQSRHTLWPLDQFDHVIRLESFAADFTTMLEATGRSLDPALLADVLPQDRNKKTGASNKLDLFYTPERRTLVARLFAPDFSLFGYPV